LRSGADEFGLDDELMRGRPTVTLRSADLTPVRTPAARARRRRERSDAPIAGRTGR
jgi:hypothetical protein